MAGSVLTLVGLWVVWHKGALDRYPVQRPWLLAIGVVLLAYGTWVADKTDPMPRTSPFGRGIWRRYPPVIVGFVVLLCTFWSFSAYASQIGGAESRDMVKENLTSLPLVVVYSARDLHLDAAGVQVESIDGPDAAFRFRYRGLRLLVFSDDKYFLLPVNWTDEKDVAIVLRDSDDLRVELQRKDAEQ